MVDIGSTPTKMGELHLQDREVHTPSPPNIIPTSQDPELLTMDHVHSALRQEDSAEPPHQAEVDMDGSPTGNEGVCPHVRVGETPDCPDKGPRKQDFERLISKKRQPTTRQKVRSALNKKEPPLSHIPEHPLTPVNKDRRKQILVPAAQEPDGLIPDPNSATPGCAKVHQTTSSATSMRRAEQLLEKYVTHATDTATHLRDGATTAQPGVLEPTTADTKVNEPEPTLTQAEKYSIEKRRRR